MKSNNSTRTGMVSVSKIPQSISSFLQQVFAGCEQVECTQVQTDHQASFSFKMPDGVNVLLAIQEGGQK